MATHRPERRLATGATIVRRRVLPPPADVLVAAGDVVRPETPVARGRAEGRLLAVDLARGLLAGTAEVAAHLLVGVGQRVTAGQPLARRRGRLERHEVHSPANGVVEALADGRLFVREPGPVVVAHAHLPGRIAEVLPERGAAVCCLGTVVRGVWGTGGEGRGTLAVRCERPEEPLTWDRVGRDDAGTVLVGGVLRDPRVLHRARQFGLAGVVVGSVRPTLVGACRGLGLPVLCIEGIGGLPLAPPIYEALQGAHGRYAALSAGEGELILPAGTPDPCAAADRDDAPLPAAVGALVRITRPPHLGALARIIDLHPTEPTVGAYEPDAVEVRLSDGQRAVLPLANVEVLE